MERTYSRGDIYYADLGRGIGSEQEGRRPVIIIQNNTGNKHSPTVIVAAITSKIDAKVKLPTHYYLGKSCGLELPSVIMMEQVRTLDKRRLESYVGCLEEHHLRGFNHALAVSVALAEAEGRKSKMVLCLCPVCLGQFRDAGGYSVRQVKSSQSEKERCTLCNYRMGVDYEIKNNK